MKNKIDFFSTSENEVTNFKFNDGGRESSGYQGKTSDCVVRAIAIATNKKYEDVYNDLAIEMKKINGKRTIRNGVVKKVYHKYITNNGFKWIPCMSIGSGCKVHLKSEELPSGTLIASLSKHLCCVIDGVINDTYDCSREGTRCVYGYYIKNN